MRNINWFYCASWFIGTYVVIYKLAICFLVLYVLLIAGVKETSIEIGKDIKDIYHAVSTHTPTED